MNHMTNDERWNAQKQRSSAWENTQNAGKKRPQKTRNSRSQKSQPMTVSNYVNWMIKFPETPCDMNSQFHFVCLFVCTSKRTKRAILFCFATKKYRRQWLHKFVLVCLLLNGSKSMSERNCVLIYIQEAHFSAAPVIFRSQLTLSHH